jgi:hypothetical protein
MIQAFIGCTVGKDVILAALWNTIDQHWACSNATDHQFVAATARSLVIVDFSAEIDRKKTLYTQFL